MLPRPIVAPPKPKRNILVQLDGVNSWHNTFSYRSPVKLPLGTRVIVPFGRQIKVGTIVDFGRCGYAGTLREIIGLAFPQPVV